VPVTSETRFLLLVISSFHRKEEFLVSLYHRPSFLLVFPFLPHHHLFFAALLRPVRVALFQRDGKMMYNYDDFLAAIEQMSPRHYQRVIVSRFRPHLFFVSSLRHHFLTSDTSNFGRCWQKGPAPRISLPRCIRRILVEIPYG